MATYYMSEMVSPSVNGIEYWAENVEYLSGKFVSVGNAILKCIESHTSSPNVKTDIQAKKLFPITPFPMTKAERLAIVNPIDGTQINQTDEITGIYTYGDAKWNSPFVMADSLFCYKTSQQTSAVVGSAISWNVMVGNMVHSSPFVTLNAGKEYEIITSLCGVSNNANGEIQVGIYDSNNNYIENQVNAHVISAATGNYMGLSGSGYCRIKPESDIQIQLKIAAAYLTTSATIRNDGTWMKITQIGGSYYNSIGSENNPVESVHTITSVSKGATNDGSTKLFSGVDSDNTEVFSVDTGGKAIVSKIGIGIENPEFPIHIKKSFASLYVENTDNSTSSLGSYRLKSGISPFVWQMFTRDSDFFIGVNNKADYVSVDGDNGNVQINNYTKFGSDAPSIKMKEFTGTMPGLGEGTYVALNMDASRILSVSVFVTSSSGWRIPPMWKRLDNVLTDYYSYSISPFNTIELLTGENATNIVGQTYNVTVQYKP